MNERKTAFWGTGATLFALVFKNLCLTVVTAGIYLPWARTARRSYLLESTEFDGHRFRYHGTGKEMLVGYLKVAAGYLLLVGAPAAIGHFDKRAGLIAQITGLVVLVPLIPLAVYGSRRYLLGRTSLRGVRFGLESGGGGFVLLFLRGLLLTVLTLGLYGPVWQNTLRKYLTDRTRYGSSAFGYDGENGAAWKISMKGLFLGIVTLGLYYPWFIAAQVRFHAESSTFQGARFRSDLDGKDVFWILVTSFFGTALTLGIGFPWVLCYVLRTVTGKLVLEGKVDYARVSQRPASGDAAADGLANALDVGLEV